MVRYNPDGYIPSSGRKIKEDGSVVNIADLIEKLANNGIEVTGSNVALPVDLQYADLTDDQALPIRRVNVKQRVKVINELQVRNTDTITQEIDISKYKDVLFLFKNSLDVNVRVALRDPESRLFFLHREEEWVRFDSVYGYGGVTEIQPEGVNTFVLNSFAPFKELLSFGLDQIYIYITPVDTPTTGSISLDLIGIPL